MILRRRAYRSFQPLKEAIPPPPSLLRYRRFSVLLAPSRTLFTIYSPVLSFGFAPSRFRAVFRVQSQFSSPLQFSSRFSFPLVTATAAPVPPLAVSLILSARFTSGVRGSKQINCATPLELIGELSRFSAETFGASLRLSRIPRGFCAAGTACRTIRRLVLRRRAICNALRRRHAAAI